MIFIFAPVMLLHSLYLKPTHALILKQTFIFTFIESLKLVKNVLLKRHLKTLHVSVIIL
jgi:hypothetical protein